ncbi:TonB-dependent receptor plug domain-containing protein [Pontibacter sp. MBLB2868]|uniref:TonB-dependent receptor plug domain-containing protein n=1 Tax=Pontibacter sp. MBLB2868 TaxID=3451555 RepID=UPI003F7535C2
MAKFLFSEVWLIACCSLLAPVAMAQQQDTTLHQLHIVEVFGKPAEVFSAGSHVAHLDSTYLSHHASSSLADALQARTPVYFKSYGISGISTAAFRGTNASQTAVLWNGLHISSPVLGQTDFSTLPVSGFGGVALQYGSAAAVYGSGAIGGAVLLSSPVNDNRGLAADIQLEAGSFHRGFGSGNVSYSNDKVRIGASAYGRSAENDFKYNDLSRYGTPEVKQTNAAVVQHGFTQDISWLVNSRTTVAIHGWYTISDREIQPAMGSVYNNATQQDKSLRLMSLLTHDSHFGQTSIKAAYFNDYLNYTDLSTNSEADVATYQLQAEQTYTRADKWSLRGGFNLQRFIAENDGYAGVKDENRASAFALFRFDPVKQLKLSLNLRQAFVEGYNPHPTPAMGVEWKFYNNNTHQLSLKGSASGSYRVPTLNDRFWQGAGNPSLKPEQGWSYESGLRHVLVPGNFFLLETEATSYFMQIDDWIQWSPNARGQWRPTNLQQVISKGMELSTQATMKRGEFTLSGAAGYTYTSSEQAKVYEGTGDKGKQLMYVPHHKAILNASIKYKQLTVSGDLNFTGLRYTSNSESGYLNSFMLLNLALSKELSVGPNRLVLSLRSDNVTNTVYQTMAYRAMPPRGYTFSIRFLIP